MKNLNDTNKHLLTMPNATALIIANMIGTGVFTSLGFQILGIKSVFALLMLWLVGGLVALSCSFCFVELASALPRSGGEYNFLSRIYHPAVGFLSGWVSSTLGFAGPVAISAMAFGNYFSELYPISPVASATIVLIVITALNFLSMKISKRIHTAITLMNITLILVLCVCGLLLADNPEFTFSTGKTDWSNIFSSSFAVSLVYVSFAYSGWNAATYIIDDIKNPSQNIPKILFTGTFVVMLLYILLNFVFLYSTPISNLEGQLQVGFIAAQSIFDSTGAKVITVIILLGLLASVNSMMFMGPRVTKTIGEDFPFFKFVAQTNNQGVPVLAVFMQFTIALILIYSSTFELVMTYIGFTLSLFTTLTVAGVFVLRFKNKGKETNHYRTWGYPLTPLLFIAIECWMMIYILIDKPLASIAGLLTIFSGLIVYYIIRNQKTEPTKPII